MKLNRIAVYKAATCTLGAVAAVLFFIAWLTAHNLTFLNDQPVAFPFSVYWGLMGGMVATCAGFSTLYVLVLELYEKLRLLERPEHRDDSHPRLD